MNSSDNKNNNVLVLKNIMRRYVKGDNEIIPFHDFSLTIKSGEIVALVGPSGSGKTTLLQIAGLLDNPTAGTVLINGKDASNADDKTRTSLRREHIGFVYQFHHLLPEFSALENIALPQMIAGASFSESCAKSRLLLAELGLDKRSEHRPATLSGGECQRVAIARALANNPSLLLADEPTGNLDHHTAEQVFALLLKQAKNRGLAALIATHNMELAAKMDRTIELHGYGQSGFYSSARS